MFSRISTLYRILIVFTIIWVFGSFAGIEPWKKRNQNGWSEYIILGLLPMILLWGIIWIVKGIKGQTKTKSIRDFFKERKIKEQQQGLSPEYITKLLLIGKQAQASGKTVRDFLFDKGCSIEESERLNALHANLKMTNEMPYHCPICNVIFKKENGKLASNGIVICYDCFNKTDLYLDLTDDNKKGGNYTLS